MLLAGIGEGAHWRNDGCEIVYSTPDGMLMAVGVTVTGAAVQLGTPTPLFRLQHQHGRLVEQSRTGAGSFEVRDHEALHTRRQTAHVLTNWQARLTAR